MSALSMRHFRCFVAVADHSNFRVAAEHLGISQPLLSQTIAALEKHLNAKLLKRRPHAGLTPSGERFLPHARRILAEARAGFAVAGAAAEGEVGRLEIGFPSWLAVGSIPELFAAFREYRPNVDLVLRDLTTAEQTRELTSGTLDVGFLRERLAGSRIRSEVVETDELVIVAPAGHRLASTQAIHSDDLHGETFIVISREAAPSLHDRMLLELARLNTGSAHTQETSEWLTMLGLVRAGAGLGLAPLALAGLKIPGLAFRQCREMQLSSSLLLSWDDSSQNPAVATLVEWLATRQHSTTPLSLVERSDLQG